MSIMNLRPPLRHLVEDDIIGFPDRLGQEIPFRLRIWQGKGQAPLVLVSHVAEDGCMWPSPSILTVRLANYINAAYLAMSSMGLLYYEDEVNWKTSLRQLWRVSFDYFGHAERLKLRKPLRQPDEWDAIEHFAGGPVER